MHCSLYIWQLNVLSFPAIPGCVVESSSNMRVQTLGNVINAQCLVQGEKFEDGMTFDKRICVYRYGESMLNQPLSSCAGES